MTFVQLEYIVSLDTQRHFSLAAAQCHVTQPTLSMQINKLEQELGLKLFDRSKQPVLPTQAGVEIIEKARKLLADRGQPAGIGRCPEGHREWRIAHWHYSHPCTLSAAPVHQFICQKISTGEAYR